MRIKSKKDFLSLNKEAILKDIVATEIELEVFSELPEDTVVGKDTKGKNDLTAKEALKIKNQNIFIFSQRLEAINRLLELESLLNKFLKLF